MQLSSLLTEPPRPRAPEPPAARLAAMLESDEVALPAPGGGDTVARWAALARWGRADLPLGRLAEGHTDAVAILRELGARPHQHACYGVWAARPGGVGAELSGDPRRLRRIAVRFSQPVLPGQEITTKFWAGGHYEAVSDAGVQVIKNGLAVVV